MHIQALAAQLEAFFDGRELDGAGLLTPLPGVLLLRHGQPTSLEPALYEPVMCLILQGRKETYLGERCISLQAGRAMIVSHDLPVLSRITVAEPEQPYLAVIVSIDLALLRGLYQEVGDSLPQAHEAESMTVQVCQPPLIDALSRTLALAGDPGAQRVLLPGLKTEIHYRLLTSAHGGMLRRLLRHDSHASHISRAIGYLRAHYRSAVAVPDLARLVGMSPSSLHKHFKRITSTTPLQYLKNLRLLEARRLLHEGADSVSTVAFEVGYESPNQFSREYTRKFGNSPRVDRLARYSGDPLG